MLRIAHLLFISIGAFAVVTPFTNGEPTTAGGNASTRQTPTPIFPKALAPGDTIMFVAPAKYLNEERVALAKKRLEKVGFKVRIPANLFRRHNFLGGTDDERAREINEAFADPEVDAIFPGTGGYGTTRILDKLDYELIRMNSKILIGFSDITGLHIAINQRTGLVTFHSPNPEFGLGTEKGLSPFAKKWFWRALLAKDYGSHDGYTIFLKPSDNDRAPDANIFQDVPQPITLVAGQAQGRLIGGNLSVLHAMMGTPYEIETDGKILFLEDVGEGPYRVDRMLNTLRQAGKFDHVAGIILGAFTAREDEAKWDNDATCDDVLRDYFSKLNVPVLMHFPVGHVRYNATLPVGAMAELDATTQTLRLLKNPVVVPTATTTSPASAQRSSVVHGESNHAQ
jgi:muramoyltetrapeptide carboxypeptidase